MTHISHVEVSSCLMAKNSEARLEMKEFSTVHKSEAGQRWGHGLMPLGEPSGSGVQALKMVKSDLLLGLWDELSDCLFELLTAQVGAERMGQ